MCSKKFEKTVKLICEKDHRYTPEAYQFIQETLEACLEKSKKDNESSKHISTEDLLETAQKYH